jgi:hypothetical protein
MRVVKFIRYENYSIDIWNNIFDTVMNDYKHLYNTHCNCQFLQNGIKITFHFQPL